MLNMQQTTITSGKISQPIKVHPLDLIKMNLQFKTLSSFFFFFAKQHFIFFSIRHEPFEVKRSMRLF